MERKENARFRHGPAGRLKVTNDHPIAREKTRFAMTVCCPQCKSTDVYRDNRYRVLGATAGGVGGAAAGLSGVGVGAAAGAAIGSVVPVLGTAIGAITGGLIGALTGGASGAVLGHKVGHSMDNKHGRHLYRCRKCGKLFAL